MSNLKNNWVTPENLDLLEYFNKRELNFFKVNNCSVMYDPTDNDYIFICCGMPSYHNKNINKVINEIKSKDYREVIEKDLNKQY